MILAKVLRYAKAGVLPLLIIIVLPSVLHFNKFSGDPPAAEPDNPETRLVCFLREQIDALALDMPRAYSQSLTVQMGFPPDGTLFEFSEQVMLRWTALQTLGASQKYVVAVAYYPFENSDASLVSPQVEYFTTTQTMYQLPLLSIHWGVPVIAWTVYVASSNDLAPLDGLGDIYRLVHIENKPYVSSSYGSIAPDF